MTSSPSRAADPGPPGANIEASTKRRRPSLPPHAWPCVAAVVFVLLMIACRYDTTNGLTQLLRFGDRLDGHRLPSLQNLPLRVFPGAGYDGQFYAQLAIDPDVRKPEVQGMMDYPQYRPRRILLPLLVHLVSGSNPWVILHVYALANVVIWLATAWVWWRQIGYAGWSGTAVWLACLLSLGALDSVRMALTDLPSTLCVLLGIMAVERGRRWPALVALTAAALTRDTTVLAAAAAENGDWRTVHTWRRQALNIVLIVLPVGLWSAWIVTQVPPTTVLGYDNFSWPGVGMLHQIVACVRELATGNLDSRYLFGLAATVSFTWQAVYLLRHSTLSALASNPWIRVGVPFAILYFVLGDAVWHGYWAVARTCLPLTFAFNLLLLQSRGRRFWWHLIAGNICLLHGLYRLLPEV